MAMLVVQGSFALPHLETLHSVNETRARHSYNRDRHKQNRSCFEMQHNVGFHPQGARKDW